MFLIGVSVLWMSYNNDTVLSTGVIIVLESLLLTGCIYPVPVLQGAVGFNLGNSIYYKRLGWLKLILLLRTLRRMTSPAAVGSNSYRLCKLFRNT